MLWLPIWEFLWNKIPFLILSKFRLPTGRENKVNNYCDLSRSYWPNKYVIPKTDSSRWKIWTLVCWFFRCASKNEWFLRKVDEILKFIQSHSNVNLFLMERLWFVWFGASCLKIPIKKYFESLTFWQTDQSRFQFELIELYIIRIMWLRASRHVITYFENHLRLISWDEFVRIDYSE